MSEPEPEPEKTSDVSSTAKPGFLDTAKVAEFWNQARAKAEEDQQTGYLQDEWPAALGHNRLRGEWAQVQRWLDEHLANREACLDVGCGSGVWLERLAPLFTRAHGIDLSSAMVESARAHVIKRGHRNVTVTCQGAMELSDDARYDLIFVGGVLMYLNDDVVGEMVAKLRRMLAPGGLLILRESTSQPEPWYRDTPLSPGLFAEPAEPGQPRPPYFAIYRRPETYRQLAEARALQLVHSQPNRDYKLADLTESTLRWIDRLRGGALRRDRPRAERAAQWIYRLRHLLLLPRYYLTRWFAPGTWKINNHWFVCRSKAGAAPEPGAPATAAAPAPSPAAPATRSS